MSRGRILAKFEECIWEIITSAAEDLKILLGKGSQHFFCFGGGVSICGQKSGRGAHTGFRARVRIFSMDTDDLGCHGLRGARVAGDHACNPNSNFPGCRRHHRSRTQVRRVGDVIRAGD